MGVVFKIVGDIGVGWDSEPLPGAGAISGRPQVSLWSFSILALPECRVVCCLLVTTISVLSSSCLCYL